MAKNGPKSHVFNLIFLKMYIFVAFVNNMTPGAEGAEENFLPFLGCLKNLKFVRKNLAGFVENGPEKFGGVC